MIIRFFLLFWISTSLYASCFDKISHLLETHESSVHWSKKLLKKYGDRKDASHLKPIFENPYKFYEQMQDRFKAQKLITPDDPLQFDYFDIMENELITMSKGILEEIKILNNRIEDAKSIKFRKKKGEKLIKDLHTGIEYLESLRNELLNSLERGSISYRRSIELSYYYSRASGYFDRMDMSLLTKTLLFVEEHIQGYKKFSIDKEFDLYKQRDFNWSRRNSKFVSSFNWGTDIFVEAFENKKELEFILMPTHAHLGIDIFHRLMNTNVHLIGMTTNPIGADGFFRPGGLFWMHDIRHSVLIHLRMKAYFKINDVNNETYKKIIPQIDQWHKEIDEASKKIEDDQLRKVTRRLIFNIYHDRGHPIVPSSITVIDKHYTMDALFHLLQETGHGIPMLKGSHKRLPEALEWIKQFWQPRHQLEREILKAKPTAVGEPSPTLFNR